MFGWAVVPCEVGCQEIFVPGLPGHSLDSLDPLASPWTIPIPWTRAKDPGSLAQVTITNKKLIVNYVPSQCGPGTVDSIMQLLFVSSLH